MNIPIYIAIPLIVAFVHYDNNRRFWPYVWARIRRWWRWHGNTPRYHHALCHGPPRIPKPPRSCGAETITNRHVYGGQVLLPMGSPAIHIDDCSIQRGSDMLLSEMSPLIVPADVHVANIPANALVVRVENASAEKMARVSRAIRKWQAKDA